MKRIELISLKLRNFKGAKDFTLDAGGGNVDVYGDNEAGKTTLFDAFIWLLFDKDSQNKKDFQIKTLDTNGNVIHGLEHEVEVVLNINGRKKTLRKVFQEKWTKKRGSATSEFTGHTTDYYVDGVPCKLKEFKDAVDEIVAEDIFKLLTNPAFFNEQLDWKKRRALLLEICGDIYDADVIAGNKALEKLPAIIGERSIEDHRKVIAAKRTEINKELDKIPVRIDEANRSKPDTSGLNEAELEQKIEKAQEKVRLKETEAARVQSGGTVLDKEKQLLIIEGDLQRIKNNFNSGSQDAINAKQREKLDLEHKKNDLEFQKKMAERKLKSHTDNIDFNKSELGRLRAEWRVVDAETFTGHQHSENCPTCGQALPSEQVQAAHDKAFAAFNRSKSERLEAINTRGKAIVTEVKQWEADATGVTDKISTLNVELETVVKAIDAAAAELQALQDTVKDVTTDPVYIAKRQEWSAVNAETQWLKTSTDDALLNVRSEIRDLKSEVERLEADKAKFDTVRKQDQRIEELKQQEKDLAAEFEKLEQELYLTEEFIRTKVAMLESKINSKFKYARFKLFNQQINGGLEEVCETLYGENLVPYSGGLNRAAQINVGLDIINTLSEHYGISAPIFIDNAEAVTKLIPTTGQQIRLIVSAADKQLRVETEALPFEDKTTIQEEISFE